MARRQGASGDSRPSPSLTRVTVRVHDLAQASVVIDVARELGLDVGLASPERGAAYLGVGYLAALGEALGRSIIADCGDDAGLVMAGFRTSMHDFLFTGEPGIRVKLESMADQIGAHVHAALLEPVVTLEPREGRHMIRHRLLPFAMSS